MKSVNIKQNDNCLDSRIHYDTHLLVVLLQNVLHSITPLLLHYIIVFCMHMFFFDCSKVCMFWDFWMALKRTIMLPLSISASFDIYIYISLRRKKLMRWNSG